MTTIKVGTKVRGLGRNGRSWSPRPVGEVTLVWRNRHDEFVRVAWDGTCVEDDMRRSEIEVAR